LDWFYQTKSALMVGQGAFGFKSLRGMLTQVSAAAKQKSKFDESTVFEIFTK